MAEIVPGTKMYDVSIIIISYNPQWSDLLSTLKSVISQIDISFEIIVADDGSKKNYEKEIIEFFEDNGIVDYTLVMNRKNQGTVCNLMSGLKVARGKYVKNIGPGDYLYSKTTLSRWIQYMEKEGMDWSFSEAVYYINDGEETKLVGVQAHPNDLTPYLNKNILESRWTYVVIGDLALGASMLFKTELQYTYCERLLNKVIYAEDYMARIMMFDGIESGYYPEKTIYYQYGTGVSTSSNKKWERLLKNDWKNADRIIEKSSFEDLDKFQRQMLKGIKWRNKKFLKIFVHGEIKSVLYRKFKIRKTKAF